MMMALMMIMAKMELFFRWQILSSVQVHTPAVNAQSWQYGMVIRKEGAKTKTPEGLKGRTNESRQLSLGKEKNFFSQILN